MAILDSAPLDVVDAYRTCEFVTLGRDGTPLAWPTAVRRREDGSLLVTTSLAFAQKALNVRRDGRVGLLFSDPTGSGLEHAPQVFVSGTAVCPDEILAGPEGAEEYWRMLFERQPHSRAYVAAPGRWFMSWYYLRLLITIEPDRVGVRPPLAELLDAPLPDAPPAEGQATESLLGAELLAGFPSAVLGARDVSGAPVLQRTRPRPTGEGYAVEVAAGTEIVPGPAGLLVHRHDEQLNHMHNALVRGVLRSVGERWLFVPTGLVAPVGAGRPRDAVRTLRNARKATARYLDRRGLPQPRVQWDRFAALAAPAAPARQRDGD
ncbi:pyridoxamine 5'-phosphate oxidase [Streptacidiphilus sp. PB12-B1b]|uniref:pyridoxamine 5'-phosphate oxidase family protein n=1 Tax=Streptacidiphilus sp. PB12-B1b TaxID=2705012 RepID=UPI0015F83091|nr:pyridoxamine 5'-phosphate oxidase family protein [Streptacidiphilus sp. PB12-B1b]QMU77993.1 pyridoxamine 5'-phosphate oxidase [Streptacidiphilus sp. PB12-B1b]